jgi:nitroimidazol reductase NimA-like FMN-containing flavoprotein (pyridoxamine 5'-phosphate oxidase superfamily)
MTPPALSTANAEIARRILDTSSYVVLATADANGMPWASPVWFAMHDYAVLYWASFPGARHSQNIAMRPQVGMVVFDSTVPPGTGQGVYTSAGVEQLSDRAAIEQGLAAFSSKSMRQGAEAWGLERVTGAARLRLYRATILELSILDPDSPFDVRIPVDGRAGIDDKDD